MPARSSTIAGHGEATRMKFGSVGLACSCEYMSKPKTDHPVRGRDVLFGVDGHAGDLNRLTVPADGAHEVSLDRVKDIVVTICQAKNDDHGCGNRLCFSRTAPMISSRTCPCGRSERNRGLDGPFFSC